MIDVLVINATTGEKTERQFTSAEIAQREADAAAEATRQQAEADAEAARIAAIQSAQDELQGLGLGDAAIATISGYPYPYTG